MAIQPRANQIAFFRQDDAALPKPLAHSGSLVQSQQQWQSSHTLNDLATSPDTPSVEATDWSLDLNTDIKGTWQGQATPNLDLFGDSVTATEVNLNLKASLTDMTINQSLVLDLKDPAVLPVATVSTGLEFLQADGKSWLTVQETSHLTNEQSHRLEATYTPIENLKIKTAFTDPQTALTEGLLTYDLQPVQDVTVDTKMEFSQQGEAIIRQQRAGFKYAPTEQPLNIRGFQEARQETTQKSTTRDVAVTYRDYTLGYAHKQTQVEDSLGPQNQERNWRFAGTVADDLNLNLTWNEQQNWLAEPNETGALVFKPENKRGVSFATEWKFVPGAKLTFNVDREDSTNTPTQRKCGLGWQQEIAPQHNLGLNYSQSIQNRSYELHYQQQEPAEPDEHLDLNLKHLKDFTRDGTVENQVAVEYATVSQGDNPLVLSSRLSYSSQSSMTPWQGQIHLAGKDKSSLPFELVIERLPDRSTQLTLNYSKDI